MNRSRETVEMNVPPGNHPAVPRDWIRGVPEWYVAGGACPACPGHSPGEPVEGTPEDARKDAYIRGRSRRSMKHPGYNKE